MGLVRVFSGCGAADIAYATIFGHVKALRSVISIKVLPYAQRQWVELKRMTFALFSDRP